MYNSNKELVEGLAATIDNLECILNGLSAERARTARGGDENWSVVEVVCHLRDTEEMMLQRMRTMRDEENPRIAGFDQDALAIEKNYAADDLRAAFGAFVALRKQHTAELAALSPEQWERTGTHGIPGPVTIFSHTLHDFWHDTIHLAQIARQLKDA